MAYCKISGKAQQRRFHPSQVLPIWTTTHTDTVTLAFQAVLYRLGITDTASYFQKLRIPIAIGVVVCAVAGSIKYGITGFFVGGLLGMLAPAAVLWMGVMLVGIAIFLAIYCLAWAAIWAILCWLISDFLPF